MVSNYDRVKEKALSTGTTMHEFIKALELASAFNLEHADPVSYADLKALADKNMLAFDIYDATMLDKARGNATADDHPVDCTCDDCAAVLRSAGYSLMGDNDE